MLEIAFSSSFIRSYKKLVKKNPNTELLFDEKIKIFINNPFDSVLKTHKLSGKLNEVWSFSINYQLRVTFIFTDNGKAILEDIGNHDYIY
jgi:toxin HigB-1